MRGERSGRGRASTSDAAAARASPSRAATGRWEEFRLHVRLGLARELEWCDLEEVLLQTAIYAGVPAANTGFHAAAEERNNRSALPR